MDIKELLDQKYYQYNNSHFIETDPIQIPHSFSLQEDIEISAFLASTIAWGRREMIIKNAKHMMNVMGNSPYNFVMDFNENKIENIEKVVHRTFQHQDFLYTIASLQNIYKNHGGLKNVFENSFKKYGNVKDTLIEFRKIFFECKFPLRTQKHIADVNRGAAGKRLNMFLMWLCRKDKSGVHFGIWNIDNSKLMLPLDTHTASTGRKLGLITRTQNDWKTVEEITENLRKFNPEDPVRYDFALFGLGIFENF
ncbi:MAG: TIGR02757 family protein [Bacteroidales bacterium]|nr:TIGR02757 family protein [Bacteroidales bacterium]